MGMRVEKLGPEADISLGDELVASLTEGVAILRGEVKAARLHPAADAVDVVLLRKRLRLTQAAFAERFGFSVATVRDWEQRRFQPDRTARSYLAVIEREPEVVQRALEAARR